MLSSTLQAGSMSSMVMRVAAWDWCASRRIVSVIFSGVLVAKSM